MLEDNISKSDKSSSNNSKSNESSIAVSAVDATRIDNIAKQLFLRSPSHLKFNTWYHPEICHYLLQLSDNQAQFIRVIFPDDGCTNNTATFKANLRELVMLAVKVNKPAIFICKEPGADNHFVCGIVKNDQMLLINPLGITTKSDCYSTLAQLKQEKTLSEIWLSSNKLQRPEYEEGLVSCGPITLELAMHLMTQHSLQQIEEYWKTLATNESVFEEDSRLTYHGVNIDSILPEILRKLFAAADPQSYIEQMHSIRKLHLQQLEVLSAQRAKTTGIDINTYLKTCKEAASPQVVFNALITKHKTINTINELSEYQLFLQDLSEPKKIHSNSIASTDLPSTKNQQPSSPGNAVPISVAGKPLASSDQSGDQQRSSQKPLSTDNTINELRSKLSSELKITDDDLNLPAYIVNIPIKVDSDSEVNTSDGEDNDNMFPEYYFAKPASYFRLLPKEETINTGSEGVIKKYHQRGVIITPYITKSSTILEPPLSANSKALEEQDRLTKVFSEQSFGANSEESKKISKKRLSLNLGFNKMRSLSRSRNHSVQKTINVPVSADIPLKKFGFLWDGIWQEFNNNTQTWSPVHYDRIHKFYRQLKKRDKTKAKSFRQEIEKSRGHMVPYREIREAIKNHVNTRSFVREYRATHPQQSIYLGFFDNDTKKLRRKRGRGTFSVFDLEYQKNPNMQIASTGYRVSEPDNILLEVGVLFDLWVRHYTAQYVKQGIYYPEPCAIVKVPSDVDTVIEHFTIDGDTNYESPKEMPVLIDNVIKMRKLDPQKVMAFNAEGAIVTTTPDRMQRKFTAVHSDNNKIILWRLADFRTIRDINQSHYMSRDWAINVLRAFIIPAKITLTVPANKIITIIDQKVINDILISLISRLFKVFDPVAIAERLCVVGEAASFQKCLIEVVQNYAKTQFVLIPQERKVENKIKSKKDSTKAQDIREIWKFVDALNSIDSIVEVLQIILNQGLIDVRLIVSAAQACGRKVAEIIKYNFSLDYAQLSYNLLTTLFKEHKIKEEKYSDSQLYQMILHNTILDNKDNVLSLVRKMKLPELGVYKTYPLHWAAITGNILAVEWLISKRDVSTVKWIGDISRAAAANILPLHCAIRYCAYNGTNLHLLRLLCNADLISKETDDGLSPIQMIIDELEDPLPVLDNFLKIYKDGISLDTGNCNKIDEVIINAIKEGYDDLACFLIDFYGDERSLIYDAIAEMSPDVDEKLIAWVRDNDGDFQENFEGMLDEMSPSERIHFNWNIGYNSEPEEEPEEEPEQGAEEDPEGEPEDRSEGEPADIPDGRPAEQVTVEHHGTSDEVKPDTQEQQKASIIRASILLAKLNIHAEQHRLSPQTKTIQSTGLEDNVSKSDEVHEEVQSNLKP